MNNWRLLLFAFVAVLLPVGSFTERNLFDGREQCCDHRSDYPEARLHGTYRRSAQEDRNLSTRLLADRSDTRDIKRYETRYGDPLTHSDSGQRVSVERRFTESERSVRNQERQQRNLPESRLTRIGTSRRDLNRNDRVSLDSTRRNTLDDTRFERRTRDADLNRNFRTENERRISVRTERNEIKKDIKPTEEFIQHELRLKNERVVLRLRENIRDSRNFRTSEERRELRRMASNAERRHINQLRDSRESVERRDIRNIERVTRDELELKRVKKIMQQRGDNRQSRDTESTVLRESFRCEEQRRFLQDPLDSGALRMREIRSLERLERVEDSRDVRIEARSNERLEHTSERSRISEDRMSRLRESRVRAEPQTTASLSRVENTRLEAPQRSNVRKDERLEVRNRSFENRAVSRSFVRKDSGLSRRFNVADRAERNYESERKITNARGQMEIIDSRVSEERRETRRMSPDHSTRVAKIVRARVGDQSERTLDEMRKMREMSDISNFRNSEMARDRRAVDARNTLSAVRNVRDTKREVTRDRRSVDDRSDSRREFRLSRERSSLERSRTLDAPNTPSAVRNVRDFEREVTRDRRFVDDRSDSRRELRLSRERLLLERSRNLDARNTLSAVRNVRDIEREVTRDRRSVDDRSDSRREFRQRSLLERSRNLDARNTLTAVRNVRDFEREVTRDRKSVDDRSDSRREFRLNRERSSIERSRDLDARNTLTAVRNVRDFEREVTRDRRSVDDRSDSRRESKLSRERSSLERSRILDARDTLSTVRDTKREVTRDRRSVDDRSDSRREFRLTREISIERSRNLNARNTLSAVRNVQDGQREVTRDHRSVDRIDSRRERTTLDRSRSLEARNERETRNRVARNERQTQRVMHNERTTTIRPQIDRLAVERNDRNTEARNRIQAIFRIGENVINEKTENQDGTNWQYMFYTLQAAYLCGLLVQMITENPMKSKTRNFSWWLPASNNLIKVD